MMKKRFDCVEMMHRGAERVRARTEGLSVEEQVAYWRNRTELLQQERRAAVNDQRKRKASTAAR